MTGSEFLKKAPKRLVAAEILMFWRCQYHGMISKNSSGNGVDQHDLKCYRRQRYRRAFGGAQIMCGC